MAEFQDQSKPDALARPDRPSAGEMKVSYSEDAIAPVQSSEMAQSGVKAHELAIDLDDVNQLDLTTQRSRILFGGFFDQLDIKFDQLDQAEARNLIRMFLPDLIRYQHSLRADRIEHYFNKAAREVLVEVEGMFRRETDAIVAQKGEIISQLIADHQRARSAKA